MHNCIFCGAQEPVHCKHLSHEFVWSIVHRQKQAGVNEPVINFLYNYVLAEMQKETDKRESSSKLLPQDENMEDIGVQHTKKCAEECADLNIDDCFDDGIHDGIDDGIHDGIDDVDGSHQNAEVETNLKECVDEYHGDDNDHANPYFNSCMCCYYWVSRRQHQNLIPLPMQNLFWYVRTLTGSEKKKCDSRLLLRLVKTITETGNMYASFFTLDELHGMLAIGQLAQLVQKDFESLNKHDSKQGHPLFCVKKELAALWHSNNGDSILITHAHAADLLR
jgi:hypothetical protein